MSTPPSGFTSPEQIRELNRTMAENILAAEPAPYAEGGYVRRVADIRGRRSGHVHAVPLAVITRSGRRYLVSPTRERNWVRNLYADPACTIRSRDTEEDSRAVPVRDRDEITDVVSTYITRMNAPWAVAQFPFPADATRSQIHQAADHVAVFHLEHRAAE